MRLVRCQEQTASVGGPRAGWRGDLVTLPREAGTAVARGGYLPLAGPEWLWVKLCVGSRDLNVCVCFSQFQMGKEISVPVYVIMNILWGKNGQVSLVWSGMGKADLKTEWLFKKVSVNLLHKTTGLNFLFLLCIIMLTSPLCISFNTFSIWVQPWETKLNHCSIQFLPYTFEIKYFSGWLIISHWGIFIIAILLRLNAP